MKLYYGILLIIQLLLAFLSGDKHKTAYLLYLWKSLSGYGTQTGTHRKNSTKLAKYKETKSEVDNNEYSLLLER
jgi:hypothetical protein